MSVLLNDTYCFVKTYFFLISTKYISLAYSFHVFATFVEALNRY